MLRFLSIAALALAITLSPNESKAQAVQQPIKEVIASLLEIHGEVPRIRMLSHGDLILILVNDTTGTCTTIGAKPNMPNVTWVLNACEGFTILEPAKKTGHKISWKEIHNGRQGSDTGF